MSIWCQCNKGVDEYGFLNCLHNLGEHGLDRKAIEGRDSLSSRSSRTGRGHCRVWRWEATLMRCAEIGGHILTTFRILGNKQDQATANVHPPEPCINATILLLNLPQDYPFSSSLCSQVLHEERQSKFFEDAAREEAEAASGSTSSLTRVVYEQHENWDGDERNQDTVLRMLVDKYKPLCTGSIQSAEQKLKLSPPQPLGDIPLTATNTFPTTPNISLEPSGGSWATQPLLPSSEDHRPWHTTFKVPSHEVWSVKLANLPSPIPSTRTSAQFSVDEHESKKEKEEFKRTKQARRLTQARDSTLDYKLGVKRRSCERPANQSRRFEGMDEFTRGKRIYFLLVCLFCRLIKVQKARKAGLFNIVKGRGKPLIQAVEEFNPFLPRQEFLMNRIEMAQCPLGLKFKEVRPSSTCPACKTRPHPQYRARERNSNITRKPPPVLGPTHTA